jgi:outer membrane protein OmpA-like peptidoglycan-associated protein
MKAMFTRYFTIGISAVLVLPACHMALTTQVDPVGAVAGDGIGASIGNQFGRDGTAAGAIYRAAVGGTTGAFIGRDMDKQAGELSSDLKGTSVTRVGEGIRITFNSELLFGVGESMLSGTAQINLNELAQTLRKYEDTVILVEGHTDSDGAERDNQELSERRANLVKVYLVSQGVSSERISTMGYGELQPVSENSTASGKAGNRRVEIAIYANKRMKRAAEKGRL